MSFGCIKISDHHYRKISLLMNWPGLGLIEISSTKKTKLLRILEKTRCLAYH